MRLLIATTHRAIVGGVETYLWAVLPALRALGHDLALLCENLDYPPGRAVDDGCPGLPVWGPHQLAKAVGWRPDVCYTQGLVDPDLDAEVTDRLPTVLFAHNYYGTCATGTKRFAFPNREPCHRTLGLGCLAWFYPRRCGGLNPLTALQLYRDQRQRAEVLPRYRAVLVASRAMADEYRRAGLPADRVRLVPLFPPGCQPDPEPPPLRPATGRVLMVGRLSELKGGRLVPAALRGAMCRLGQPLTLVLAGDGPDRPAVLAKAARTGVAVEVVGWVGPDRRVELMRGADLLVVPSTWPEPFGLVGVEGQCVGLPAAAFAVGGVPDWLVPGISGELAPADPPTPTGLAEAIGRALGDTNHWQRLRVGAWETAGRFTLAGHLKLLLSELTAAAGRT